MRDLIFLLLLLPVVVGCSKTDNDIEQPIYEEEMYFPSNTDWETKSIEDLGWNTSAIEPLKEFLENADSKSFMIIVNGRIVMEEYFNGHSASATWQWNSAGKTLVTATVGIAQEEGFLNINSKVSDYLGVGWTSEPLDKENLITSKHLLTMTSGINDEKELVIKNNLTYLEDAGMRWSYHNVFQKLMDVVEEATDQDFESYFDTKIKAKLDMDGFWNNGLIFRIYHSNTRSMAKFGLLALNKGNWSGEQIVNESFFNESISTSQNINPSYGYLWWLNGKSSFMIPGEQTVYSGALVPNAPSDMYGAMGASDQRIYIIPSKNMVVVRMGEALDSSTPSFAVSGFDALLWEKLNNLIN